MRRYRHAASTLHRTFLNLCLFCVCFGLAALFTTGCSRPALVIGFVGPLTGSSSAVGLGCRNGFLMAFGEVEKNGSRKNPVYELLVKDDANDPDTCLAAFKELKEEGCSTIVLGTTSNAASKALPWAMENGIFVISPTVSSFDASGGPQLFVRVNTASAEYGVRLAQIAREKYNIRKMGIIGDDRNKSYVKAVHDAFVSEYASLGGITGFSQFFDSMAQKPAADFIASLGKTGCDGVLIIAASTDVVLLVKELQKSGLAPQVFLPPWPFTLDLLHNGGTAVEGVVGISIADLGYASPAAKLFETNYLKEFGESPSFTAMFGYEASSILLRGIAAGSGFKPAEIRQAIINIGDFDGLQGAISFNEKAEADREMFLFTIRNGAFIRVE